MMVDAAPALPYGGDAPAYDDVSTGEVGGAESALFGMTEIPELDEIRVRAHSLCREYLRGAWRRIQPYEMIVRKISGGLSNLLYYCCLPASTPSCHGEPSRVVLRLYGQNPGLQGVIAESVIFTLLSESQRGPRLFGVFPGGRLEEYIQARPLVSEELHDPELSVLIAEKLAQVHMMSVPISKEPRWLWDSMQRWMVTIDQFVSDEPIREQLQVMKDQLETFDLAGEFEWLRQYLSRQHSAVVFCHNDIQGGNILLRDRAEQDRVYARVAEVSQGVSGGGKAKTPEEVRLRPRTADDLVVIDFEYCAYNYRAYDIANHLCEWVYDYTNEAHPYFWARQSHYPDIHQQHRFVRRYLATLRQGVEPAEEDVLRLVAEVRAFTLASHFYWALWSVVNATKSTIHFDYWEYGKERFQSYFRLKSELPERELDPTAAVLPISRQDSL